MYPDVTVSDRPHAAHLVPYRYIPYYHLKPTEHALMKVFLRLFMPAIRYITNFRPKKNAQLRTFYKDQRSCQL